MEDTGARVSGFTAERDLALERIEGDTVGDEVGDAARGLGTEDAGGGFIDQPGAGGDGIGEVLLDGIQRANGGRDAALRPARVAIFDGALGEDEDGAEMARFEGDEQPRDAGADDD